MIYWYCKEKIGVGHSGDVRVMLHETIRNDDFERNTAYQCWNNVATIRNNVATML